MTTTVNRRTHVPMQITHAGEIHLLSSKAIELLRNVRRDPELTYSWLYALLRRKRIAAVNKFGCWYISAASIRDYGKRTRAWSRPPTYKSAHKR